MIGGVVAGDIWLDPAGEPGDMKVLLDNPTSQKIVKIETTLQNSPYDAKSTAIVQVNKSGSLAVNAWFVQ